MGVPLWILVMQVVIYSSQVDRPYYALIVAQK